MSKPRFGAVTSLQMLEGCLLALVGVGQFAVFTLMGPNWIYQLLQLALVVLAVLVGFWLIPLSIAQHKARSQRV